MGKIRFMCYVGSWQMWVWEGTSTKPIIKLVEAVYMGKHEHDFVLEEEAYRML